MNDDPKSDPAPDRVAETVHPYGEQDEWGNSIANIRHNLRLTPLERLREADEMVRFFEKYKGVLYRRQV